VELEKAGVDVVGFGLREPKGLVAASIALVARRASSQSLLNRRRL